MSKNDRRAWSKKVLHEERKKKCKIEFDGKVEGKRDINNMDFIVDENS